MLDYSLGIDIENMKQFHKTNTLINDRPIYRCVLCYEPTSIQDSYSHKGHKLICISCFHRKFGVAYDLAFRWMKE